MTQRRQERNRRGAARAVAAALLAVACATGFAAQETASATEQIVVSRSSGLAIGGYDPVAYFTEGKPLIGREEFEASHRGAIWRFVNRGNRAALLADPEIYEPQFGGYDPVDVARGVPVPGLPTVWAIVEQRLFLFASPVSHADFLANPQRYLGAARGSWPALRDTLAR
jgi:hypothetical protein